MQDIWKIAKWEILRNLTNKQFLIGLVLTPVIMALFGGLPMLLEKWNQPTLATYYVIDEIDALEDIRALLPDNVQVQLTTSSDTIVDQVRETKASGYFHLTTDFVQSGQIDLI